ncbi:hypothetical protein [Nocardioides ochotonae]|uniref:hypothetical protein n=1 Tax=Nocardioides ochotonae TaxID=2685869 RepID=UPI00140C4714|nr:hypothetical protein [Nocardioides ochotonae]
MRIGDIDLHPLTDGTFRAGPGYFGAHVIAHGHEDYVASDDKAFLPIGCFLIGGQLTSSTTTRRSPPGLTS